MPQYFLTGTDIRFELLESELHIFSEVRCKGETGVEMEALTAVSTAALTVYDMCKAVQRDMTITDIRLLYKEGGKSGVFEGEGSMAEVTAVNISEKKACASMRCPISTCFPTTVSSATRTRETGTGR